MADTPHFDIPFRFAVQGDGRLAAAVNEQDSRRDLEACVEAIARTPAGFREELPEFGITPPEFSQGGPDLDRLRGEIEAWEERAAVELDADPETFDPIIRATVEPVND